MKITPPDSYAAVPPDPCDCQLSNGWQKRPETPRLRGIPTTRLQYLATFLPPASCGAVTRRRASPIDGAKILVTLWPPGGGCVRVPRVRVGVFLVGNRLLAAGPDSRPLSGAGVSVIPALSGRRRVQDSFNCASHIRDPWVVDPPKIAIPSPGAVDDRARRDAEPMNLDGSALRA